jgi:DNA-binding response OmpR family regulator
MMDRRTALIVEDDPTLQMAMAKRLARMGFDVASASHFEAADSHLTARTLHIACIHARLPSRSGYELCEHIRGPLGLLDLPVLIMCQDASPGDMAYAEDVGGNAFLRKPFTMGQFADCVEFLLNATRWSHPPMRQLQPLMPRPAAHVASRPSEQALFVAA